MREAGMKFKSFKSKNIDVFLESSTFAYIIPKKKLLHNGSNSRFKSNSHSIFKGSVSSCVWLVEERMHVLHTGNFLISPDISVVFCLAIRCIVWPPSAAAHFYDCCSSLFSNRRKTNRKSCARLNSNWAHNFGSLACTYIRILYGDVDILCTNCARTLHVSPFVVV